MGKGNTPGLEHLQPIVAQVLAFYAMDYTRRAPYNTTRRLFRRRPFAKQTAGLSVLNVVPAHDILPVRSQSHTHNRQYFRHKAPLTLSHTQHSTAQHSTAYGVDIQPGNQELQKRSLAVQNTKSVLTTAQPYKAMETLTMKVYGR